MKKLMFIILCIPCVAFAQATDNQYRQSTTSSRTPDENFKRLIAWWNSYQDCAGKKLVDSVRNSTSREIHLTGNIPVQYTMYGGTSDGGIVKFKLKLTMTENSVEYQFYDLIHKATPGVKHKDGGEVLQEKPTKGSAIFGKTWKSYQDQTMTFIHATENEIIKTVK